MMERLFGFLDPGMLAGGFVVLMLFLCFALLYSMRDHTNYPRRVAHRRRCPHHPDQKFTVEIIESDPGTVAYCSAFLYGKVPCDQACVAAAGARALPRVQASRPALHVSFKQ